MILILVNTIIVGHQMHYINLLMNWRIQLFLIYEFTILHSFTCSHVFFLYHFFLLNLNKLSSLMIIYCFTLNI